MNNLETGIRHTLPGSAFKYFVADLDSPSPIETIRNILSVHSSWEMVGFLYFRSIPELSARNKCESPIQAIDENVLASALKKGHLK